MKSLTLATVSGIALFVIVFCETTAQAHRPAAVESFVTIDVPGARNTGASGINDHGDVVGGYTLANDTLLVHGFLLKDGVFTSITVPGATSTSPYDVNNRGDIVGSYDSAGANTRSFLLRDGVFATIEVPTIAGLIATGINNRGDIVGHYRGVNGLPSGFLLDHRGAFSTIDYPGGVFTSATGINARGDIVGTYIRPEFKAGMRGFLRDSDGTFTAIDVGQRTLPSGINTLGEIVGQHWEEYNPDNLPSHAFVRDQYGNVTAVEVPGAIGTSTAGINDRGNIVGSYTDAEGSHGFVSHRDNGDRGDGDHGRGDHGDGDRGRGDHGRGDPRPGMISHR